MLDEATKAQLKTYLDRLVEPIELTANLDNSDNARQMDEFLKDTAGLSSKITLKYVTDASLRQPSFSIARQGQKARVHFCIIPMGHEFSSFILALLQASGYPSKENPQLLDTIKSLQGTFKFDVYASLSCHNCPDVVQALNLMAILNENIEVNVIDGGLFPEEVKAKHILGVPTVHLNNENFISGRRELTEIVSLLDTSFAQKKADELSQKEQFDVLVLGAGPAGTTAAIYAARKGLRTGIVAERPGGQVNETASIENFTSIKETTGTQLAQNLMQHVGVYDVDVMAPFSVKSIERIDSIWHVHLAEGGHLKSKTLIAATGARWREVGVTGEKEYKSKGIAYCPHCDGPLFKGQDVIVIGGGNSGVEAAIDLAGICKSVTLLQRGDALTADEVLQKRLFALSNVKVIFNTCVQKFVGDGQKLTGVVYTDTNACGQEITLTAQGCFVQIGLVPNTDWARGAVELDQWNQIPVDAHCATTSAGFFAAGDCTNVPYKQIVVAVGEGAKASLAAFDYLIRNN